MNHKQLIGVTLVGLASMIPLGAIVTMLKKTYMYRTLQQLQFQQLP